MKSQNNLNTDAVEESVAVSCNPGADEGDISEEEGGTDDSTYETEEEPTTEVESEEDEDLDRSQHTKLVSPVTTGLYLKCS